MFSRSLLTSSELSVLGSLVLGWSTSARSTSGTSAGAFPWKDVGGGGMCQISEAVMGSGPNTRVQHANASFQTLFQVMTKMKM